jgi:hypothetical protein
LLTPAHLPAILQHSDVHEANVWVNIRPVASSLHYDGNHNLLHVDRGRKEVLLVSPALTAHLQPSALHSSTPNHSCLGRGALLQVLQHTDAFALKQAFRVSLGPGDCLHIPEGWWHQVSSEAGTFATNFWFRSPLHAIVSRAGFASVAPYVVRSALLEMLAAQLSTSTSSLDSSGGRSSPGRALRYSIEDFAFPADLFASPGVEPVSPLLQRRRQQCLLELCTHFATATLEDMEQYWVAFAQQVRTPVLCVVMQDKIECFGCMFHIVVCLLFRTLRCGRRSCSA